MNKWLIAIINLLGLTAAAAEETWKYYTLTRRENIHCDSRDLHDFNVMNNFTPSVSYENRVRNKQGAFS